MPEQKYEEYRLLGSDDEPASDSATSNENRQAKSLTIPSCLLSKDIWKVFAVGFIFTLSLAAGLVIGSKLQKASHVNTILSYRKYRTTKSRAPC